MDQAAVLIEIHIFSRHMLNRASSTGTTGDTGLPYWMVLTCCNIIASFDYDGTCFMLLSAYWSISIPRMCFMTSSSVETVGGRGCQRIKVGFVFQLDCTKTLYPKLIVRPQDLSL